VKRAKRMAVTVAELRKKYPWPLRASQASGYVEDEYCVGGAICKEMGIERHGCNFPTAGEIRTAIERANPNLDHYLMTNVDSGSFDDSCEAIVKFNDCGTFEQAWKEMEKLLKWKPKLRTIEDICAEVDDPD
jgi:hypothetical protein